MLPAMTLAEALGTTRIHRVAGRTGGCTAFSVANRGLVSPEPCHRCWPERWRYCKKTLHGSLRDKLAIPSACIVMWGHFLQTDAHIQQVWLVHPKVFDRGESRHTGVTF